MKHILTVKFLIFFLLFSFGCKNKKLIFNHNEITKIFLIAMEDSGDNVMRYYFADGIKKIIELLNSKNQGYSTTTSSNYEEYGKYYLRIETKSDYYTIGFTNQSDFVINIKGVENKYNIENFVNTLLDMDTYPSLDSADITGARLFDENLKINTEIPVSRVVGLLDVLSKTKDEKKSRENFIDTPLFIIRIQQTTGGFQLFCGKESVWISGKYGVYVFKSQQIADTIKEIIKNIRNR